jgi:hypothetical protein
VWDVARRKQVARFETLRDCPGGLAPSGDGKVVATGGYQDGSVRLWDVTSGKEVRRLRGHAGTVCAIAWSPDGIALATGSADTTLCLWEAASGKLLRRLEKGHRASVGAVAFSADGRTIASAGLDQAVCLWEAATGQVRRRFEGHEGPVLALSFAADGRRLVSGSNDGTALVWDVAGTSWAKPAGLRRWSAEEADALWADLAAPDAKKADRAGWELATAPAQAARILGERLRPATVLDAAMRRRIGQLLADLDAEVFGTREEATRALAEIGESAEPLLRERLAAGLSAEARRRIERVLEKRGEASGERLRASRALEALEHAGGPQARKVLEGLAGGGQGAWLTLEARASLARLARREQGK